MRNYFIIFFWVLSISLNAQTKFNPALISKPTDKVVKKIEKINELMGSAVYYAGTRPAQYDNFEKLKEIASKTELLELTNHPNGVVRCYAFWALSYDKSVEMFPIIVNHIQDHEVVSTQFGCIGSETMVGDFFINVATPEYVDLELNKLNAAESSKLDSILIYSNSKLNAKSSAVYRAKPGELLYSKIRELVVENNDQAALVTLAKYRKQEDIPLIVKNRMKDESEEGYFFTYKAIQEFPHSDFMPFLEKNLKATLDHTHYSTEWRELYKAIASFRNEKSVELLEIPFSQVQHQNIRKYHIDFVYAAIQSHKSEIYDPLLWKMWKEENRISPDVYNYLKERDAVKAYELAKRSMLQSDEMYFENLGLSFGDFGSTENLTSMMLDEILRKDKKTGIEVVCKNIKDANVHQFPIFTAKVIQLKDPAFVEPLFERFQRESNPHVYLKIAEALISYQDGDINKRILNTKKNNVELNKDWGGDALDKMLRDKNLLN